MRQVMVRYTVKADKAEENRRLVQDVFESLSREKPAGLSYSCYQLEDGVSFVHVARIENENDNPLLKVPAFKTFTAGVKERCDVPPATTVMHEVGSYPK